MDRRRFSSWALAALCAAEWAFAQAPRRVRRVVVVESMREETKERFRALFAERGWKAGDNIELEFSGLLRMGPVEERRERAREAVASRPDAFMGPGDAAAPLLMPLTSTIPIVFYNYGTDPVRDGFVQSLRRPGGNVTGTTQLLMQMIPKFWELLKAFRPDARRGAYLRRESLESRFLPQIREQTAIAAKLNALDIIELIYPDSASFAQVQSDIDASGVELVEMGEAYGAMWTDDVLKHLERRRIPNVHIFPGAVRRGGLLSLSPDFREGERQAVAIVDRILRGERPATIPVHEVTRYHIAVNARTARQMGIRVPPSILLLANEVIDQ